MAGLSLREVVSDCYSSLSCILCFFFSACFGRALGPLALCPLLNVGVSSDCYSSLSCTFCSCLCLLRQGLRALGFVPAVERRRLLPFGTSMDMQQTVSMQSSLREQLCSVFCFLASAGLLGPLALWPLVNVGVSSNSLQVFVMYFCCLHMFSALSSDVLPWRFEL